MKLYFFTIILSSVLLISCYSPKHYKNTEPIEVDFSDTITNTEIYTDSSKSEPLYVAISAMISPKETFIQYQKLLNYISKKLDMKIVLKQRKTYQEINDLLERGELDFALICTGAFIKVKNKFPLHLLAVPLVNNEPYYQAYLLVNKNSTIKSFIDFKNRSFAYTDPISNTGYMFVQGLLGNMKLKSDEFFTKTIFTYAHDYSIQAVSKGIVDGASIDGLIYEYLAKYYPERVENIKIIYKSKKFGIPPFVYSNNTDRALIKKIKAIMLDMHNDEDGKVILENILIDKFVPGDISLYNSLR